MSTSPDEKDAHGGAHPEAFPKTLRLRRRSEFRRVQDHGRKVHTGHFILFVSECADGQKLGITATRKVGNAVVRNRLKRSVREVYRRHRAAFPRGQAVVVLIKRGMQDLDSRTVEDELLRAAKRL
ncbi:MAG TPA: ribonuclease P protein component [Polyangia bacterium]|jgi:ribonuclease P protein component